MHPTPTTARSHSTPFKLLLALYALAGLGMTVLVVRPDLASAVAPTDGAVALRAAFALAAAFNATVTIGGWRRVRWVPRLALVAHSLIAAAPLVGLASLAAGHAWLSGNVAELLAKFGVHALCAWLWSSRWMRRQFQSG